MALSRPDAGKAGTTHINFSCQKCGQPLRLDHSFNNGLDQQTYQEFMASPMSQTDTPIDLLSQIDDISSPDDDVSRKIIKPVRLISHESGNNGFTLLTSPDSNTVEDLSLRLRVMGTLFDAMSCQSDIDHPLCEECTDTLLDELDSQLELTEQECKEYRDFLERLDDDEDGFTEEQLDTELAQLRAEEETLHQQLEALECERLVLKEQFDIQKKEAKRLEEVDAKYWKTYNDHKRQLFDLEDSQKGVDNQLRYAQAHLEKLKKTNAFNATFHIWHSGHFGTINNFRLGRLPSVPVEWSEINAAWGQTVLLLHSLAKKMDLTFERYRLVPYGSHSFLESLADKQKELPLYGSGGIRFFWDTKFDQAMVAFLDCLQQFKEEVEKGDTSFCLPYPMVRGKIEDTANGQSYSIKIQFNSEEQWTKALKFMLTNLKWGLAWVSSQFGTK